MSNGTAINNQLEYVTETTEEKLKNNKEDEVKSVIRDHFNLSDIAINLRIQTQETEGQSHYNYINHNVTSRQLSSTINNTPISIRNHRVYFYYITQAILKTDCSELDEDKELQFINDFADKSKSHFDDDYGVNEAFLKMRIIEFTISLLTMTSISSAVITQNLENNNSDYGKEDRLKQLRDYGLLITSISVFITSKIYY